MVGYVSFNVKPLGLIETIIPYKNQIKTVKKYNAEEQVLLLARATDAAPVFWYARNTGRVAWGVIISQGEELIGSKAQRDCQSACGIAARFALSIFQITQRTLTDRDVPRWVLLGKFRTLQRQLCP